MKCKKWVVAILPSRKTRTGALGSSSRGAEFAVAKEDSLGSRSPP